MSPYGGVQTIIDSLDLDPDNPDMDNDSLTDGLETGNIVTIPGIGLDIAGTDINATFTWVINGLNVEVHNFTADEDPSTTTDPNKADTDGDGIPDGVEDCDMPALASSQTLKSTDLNGKFDGMGLNETNPLDRDTDDDGLVDGTEDADHDGLWDWNPSTFAGETCSWELDSDGDGLGDGLETGKNYSTIISDTNAFIFVPDSNSSTTTNPLKIDTDSDGVPDGWIDGWNMTSSGELGIFNVPDYECQFGEGEDRNLNGAVNPGETNPSVIDSDGDNLADGWDILLSSQSLYPLFNVNECGLYRYWGELNSTTHLLGTRDSVNVYQSGPTDPTCIDSDGDGLVDGDVQLNGLPYELYMNHNGFEQMMFTDPSLQDTDADGLSDGLEVAGWEVHILKGSTKQMVINWTTASNPTVYDTEGDGLNDYFEFENQSDPTKVDTDSDYIHDEDELQGELTQIEATPPKILTVDGKQISFEITSEYNDIGICVRKTIKITVRVRDTSGLDRVVFKLTGRKDATESLEDNPIESEVSVSFSYDSWHDFWDGWDVNVTAFDVFGNGNCTKTHIKGFSEGNLKLLVDWFFDFVETVAKGLNFDWVWDAISQMINNGFKPIVDAIQNFLITIQTICDFFGQTIMSCSKPNSNEMNLRINQLMNHPIMHTLKVVGIIITVISIMISPFSIMVSTLIDTVIDTISPWILCALIGRNVEGTAETSYSSPSSALNTLFLSSIGSSGTGREINWEAVAVIILFILEAICVLAQKEIAALSFVGICVGFLLNCFFIKYTTEIEQDPENFGRAMFVGLLNLLILFALTQTHDSSKYETGFWKTLSKVLLVLDWVMLIASFVNLAINANRLVNQWKAEWEQSNGDGAE